MSLKKILEDNFETTLAGGSVGFRRENAIREIKKELEDILFNACDYNIGYSKKGNLRGELKKWWGEK